MNHYSQLNLSKQIRMPQDFEGVDGIILPGGVRMENIIQLIYVFEYC
jgi:glutamine amidotransferase PdxT